MQPSDATQPPDAHDYARRVLDAMAANDTACGGQGRVSVSEAREVIELRAGHDEPLRSALYAAGGTRRVIVEALEREGQREGWREVEAGVWARE